MVLLRQRAARGSPREVEDWASAGASSEEGVWRAQGRDGQLLASHAVPSNP